MKLERGQEANRRSHTFQPSTHIDLVLDPGSAGLRPCLCTVSGGYGEIFGREVTGQTCHVRAAVSEQLSEQATSGAGLLDESAQAE